MLRGRIKRITVGLGGNVRETVVLHTEPGFPSTSGENVTFGDLALQHGCKIVAGSLIGVSNLNGASVGQSCLMR